MEEQFFHQLNKELKEISLTPEEKKMIFQRATQRPIPSPVWYLRLVHSRVLFLLALFMMGGVAYAAEYSLPGNPLYSVKVKVTEPARDVIQLTPEAALKWEETKAIRRLSEAELLAEEDKLTERKAQVLEENFSKHAEKFAQKAVKATTSTEGVRSLNTQFKSKIKDKSESVIESASKKKQSEKENEREKRNEKNAQKFVEKVRKDTEKDVERNTERNTSGKEERKDD